VILGFTYPLYWVIIDCIDPLATSHRPRFLSLEEEWQGSSVLSLLNTKLGVSWTAQKWKSLLIGSLAEKEEILLVLLLWYPFRGVRVVVGEDGKKDGGGKGGRKTKNRSLRQQFWWGALPPYWSRRLVGL
jgi:hypothetical protein